MDMNDLIEQQKLLNAFRDKAEKCSTKQDMILFCRSFLQKYSEIQKPENVAQENVPKIEPGHHLGYISVPAASQNLVYGIEMLTLSRRTGLQMVEQLDAKTAYKEILERDLVIELSKKLIEDGFVQISTEMSNFSLEYVTTARLVVGKKR